MPTVENDRWLHEYVIPYTNAATIVSPDFRDTEELDGFFSGWDPEERKYDPRSWQYEHQEPWANVGQGPGQAARTEPSGALGGRLKHPPPLRDETLRRHQNRSRPGESPCRLRR